MNKKNNSKKHRKIIKTIKRCIGYIKLLYGVELTCWNILEYIEYFQDNPQGKIENEIDSYMVKYSNEEIKEALLTLPEVNVSD
ncbi:MAG: hypothetical protein NUV97_00615 [archaeon]|nr:hypothetical protein [archaeon]